MSRMERSGNHEEVQEANKARETTRPPLAERLVPEEEIEQLDNIGKTYAHLRNIRELITEDGRLPGRADTTKYDVLAGQDTGLRFAGHHMDIDPESSLTDRASESVFVFWADAPRHGGYSPLEESGWSVGTGTFTLVETTYRDGRTETLVDYNGRNVEQMDEAYRGRVFTDELVESMKVVADELLLRLPEPSELEE